MFLGCLAASGCSPRVDYVADVNGALLPCREAGRIARATENLDASIEGRVDEVFTSVDLSRNDGASERLSVAGQIPTRAVGRRAKVCNEQFLVVGLNRDPYSIIGDRRRN
jgi:hypothetical protein